MKKQIVYGLLTDEQGDTCCHEKEKVMFGRDNQNGTSPYVEDPLQGEFSIVSLYLHNLAFAVIFYRYH